ncbi:FkbM family methyltransferase [Paraburkholderia acidicola]|uniref:FkbM family methyltransferase n=1 Tax=Paraburkholderia acidicola TaxID=1912599 RepID=A0ABV1LVH6_9BURK
MSITSYAQNFEDVMLWRALAHVENGSYIDIGAQDPIIDSVSLAFHERGWRGIHVEPTPHYAALLRQHRAGDTVIQTAVGDEQAAVRFFEIPGTGISTADENIAAQHRERGFDVREIVVPCIPLSSIFEVSAEKQIHWLKIDVEGFETQVLSSWGESAVRPWIVVVESILPLSRIETHESWEATLLAYGYASVYFDGVNRFYVSDAHPELKDTFRIPPNIFDRFVLNGTASATFHTLIEARCAKRVDEVLAEIEQEKSAACSQIESLATDLALAEKVHAEHKQKWEQREQVVSQQLRDGEAELRNLLQDGVRRERALSEQTDLAHQQLEDVLRTLAKREQMAGAELLAVHQKTALERASQADHLENLLHSFAKREQEMGAQLLVVHQQAAQEKAKQVDHLENLLRSLAKREQEIGVLLLATQQKAIRENASQASEHIEQMRALQGAQAERERALNEKLDAAKQEWHLLKHEHSQSQREHAEQIGQSQQALESQLRVQLAREQEVLKQLLDIQQRAEWEKTVQADRHAQEVQALKREHLEQVEAYSRQLNATQQAVQDVTLDRAAMQHQFDGELRVELEAGQQLRDSLSLLENELATMRNTLSWRLTGPLRALAGWLVTRPATAPQAAREYADEPIASSSRQSTSPSVPGSQGVISCSSFSETSSMKSDYSTLTTQLPRSSASANLKTLLQCHDSLFVESAYLTLLKRKPDSEGYRYYLSRLRAGVSKTQILGQLYASSEARTMGVELPGLRQALKWQRLAKLPVVGGLIRSLSGAEGTTAVENRLRAIEQQIFLLGQQSELRFSQLELNLDGIKTAIESRILKNHSSEPHSSPASVAEQSSQTIVDDKTKTGSILAETIVLQNGAANDVIEQLALALVNSKEAQQLSEHCRD